MTGLEQALTYLKTGDINRAVRCAYVFLEEVDVKELAQDFEANRDEIAYKDSGQKQSINNQVSIT